MGDTFTIQAMKNRPCEAVSIGDSLLYSFDQFRPFPAVRPGILPLGGAYPSKLLRAGHGCLQDSNQVIVGGSGNSQ